MRLMLVVGLSYMLGMSIYAFNQWQIIDEAEREIKLRHVAMTMGPYFSHAEAVHLQELGYRKGRELSNTQFVLVEKYASSQQHWSHIHDREKVIREASSNLSWSLDRSWFPFLLIVIASIIWWVIRGFKARPTILNPAS